MHAPTARPPAATARPGTLRIAVTGATGLVGRALVPFLTGAGHSVVRLVRHGNASAGDGRVTDVPWDPARGTLDAAALEGVDAVVHLAGEPVSERWSTEHKRAIRDSRVQGTTLLATTLARLTRRPRVLVSASAIGIYGDGHDRVLTEDTPPARDFLGTVAQEWEGATAPAAAAGIRVAIARFGMILAPHGGALGKLLPVFRMGGGGKIGSGTQWMSWIALTDVLRALDHLILTDSARGAFNIVAPAPVTNAEFSDVLGHVLHRPALMTVPPFALKLMYGEMAEAILLAGQRASSARLEASGFAFAFPTLEAALRHELGTGAHAHE